MKGERACFWFSDRRNHRAAKSEGRTCHVPPEVCHVQRWPCELEFGCNLTWPSCRLHMAVGQNPVPLYEHQTRWQMDVRPPQNGIAIGYAWPFRLQQNSLAESPPCLTLEPSLQAPSAAECFTCRDRKDDRIDLHIWV